MKRIIAKGRDGKGLSKSEALELLEEIDNKSDLFNILLSAANQLSRKQFSSKGEVHAQIGLNWDNCQNNCQFCFFSEELNHISNPKYLEKEEIIRKAIEFDSLKVGSISLMATADYKFEKYLDIGKSVSTSLKNKTPLFGNWGDIDISQAKELKKSGFTYYYHALRLGEGQVTKLNPKDRIETIKNAHKAGLLVGSCLEPIGPEHTYREIVELLEIMKELKISWMATMKRVNVEGSPLSKYGEITDEEFAKITAVTRLFYGKTLFTMAAHEPKDICLRSGANFLVAESGTNPRDKEMETSSNRGFDVERCKKLLANQGYKIHKGNIDSRYLMMSIKNKNFIHFRQLLKNNISKIIS